MSNAIGTVPGVSRPTPRSGRDRRTGLGWPSQPFLTAAQFGAVASLVLTALSLAGAAVGQRPYELEWAHRTADHCPPVVDFEGLSGWRVESREAEATFEPSREQQLWGEHVGKLTYRGTGPEPQVRILPPEPIAIHQPFDAVTLWCYGNNWGWTTDPSTPRVGVTALFEDAAGRELAVFLATVDWKEWHLLHRRLSPEQIGRVKGGARFKGLQVTNGKNQENRLLYFDNLAVFLEAFPPLTFEPRPERGLAPLPGLSPGANRGPGRLPFPTRAQTILPTNLTTQFTTALEATAPGLDRVFTFTYSGEDGRLVYRLRPATGSWSDLAVEWQAPPVPGQTKEQPVVQLRPCVAGGVYLHTAKGPTLPERAQLLAAEQIGSEATVRWRLSAADTSTEVTYIYRLWNKSLVIDVLAPGGQVEEVRFGRATGPAVQEPRLVTNPFYPAEGHRPAVLVCGPTNAALFVTGNVDWYLSNASVLWGANAVSSEGVTYHGGTRYVPLTTGRRNDCGERFFLTVSPRYEEVLPTIPNPPSPWRHLTGTHLWRAHGASNREQDARAWTEVHRYGMTQVIVTDHETLWRDEGESFTFRTRAAPGKGGDQGAYDYARLMQDKLGFVYGPYNNFTDFAPVNEYWNFDLVSRDPQNQLQRAWMRCYAPKPARAVEYCARLAPQIQEKFHFSTAYCDVHTAVAPWHRVDYDPRVPGAGTFAAVFYAYGEIMLLQKQAWQGPVYSEGNFHCFYMGLTDGNYGQDQSYRPAENPWLVDFDLRQMHNLGCNFGLGNLDMFYANIPQPRATPEQRDAELDRFLTATVAFGHPGFLVREGGMGYTLRSYYLLQQLHSRYCLANAVEIRYLAADGQLLDTSRAVAGGAFQRSQVVTRYADGTVTAANGSRTERLRGTAFGHTFDLCPNGFAGYTADAALEVLSSDQRGHRADYAATPAYLYADGRGQFTRFPKAAANGPAVCRILSQDSYELIPFNGAEGGFALPPVTAVALSQDNQVLGPARVRSARGLTYVVPVKSAFSYRLTATNRPGPEPRLACERDFVVPGERLAVRGLQPHPVHIPTNAQPGQRLWLEFEGGWIDFTVVPLADLKADLDGNSVRLTLTSHWAEPRDFTLETASGNRPVRLAPEEPATLSIDLGAAAEESAGTWSATLRTDTSSQAIAVPWRIRREVAPLAALPARWTRGMALRGQKETADFAASGAQIQSQSIECGKTAKTGLFVHPPWQGGTGYTFLLYEPCVLPESPPAAFRASVGKANGSVPGDGIDYKLVVIDAAGTETVAAETIVREHCWQPLEADLSRWAGQRVRFKLIADAGPKDNSAGDWGAWAELRVETRQPVLLRQRVER